MPQIAARSFCLFLTVSCLGLAPSTAFGSVHGAISHEKQPPEIATLRAHLAALEDELAQLLASTDEEDRQLLPHLRRHLSNLETETLHLGSDATEVLEELRNLTRRLDAGPGAPKEEQGLDTATTASPRLAGPLPLPRPKNLESPVNDSCFAAAPIGNTSVSASLEFSTRDGSASCTFSTDHDVWYRYTASTDGFVAVFAESEAGPLVVSVHGSCPGTRLNEISCGETQGLTFEAMVGQEYLIRVASDSPASTFDLRIGPAATLTGRVRAALTGDPLPDALVHVYEEDTTPIHTLRTAASGTFTAPLARAGTYFIGVDQDGYRSEIFDDFECAESTCSPQDGTPIQVELGVETTGLEIDLGRLGQIAGRVTDTDSGDPLPFAVVRFPSLDHPSTETRTDEDGFFDQDSLQPGTWYVTVDTAGHQRKIYENIPCGSACDLEAATPIVLDLDTRVEGIDFALDQLGTITGSAVRALNGDPIPFLHIELYDSSGDFVKSGFTDAEGRYEIGGLESGTYFALARITFLQHFEHVYQNCVGCEPTDGTPIEVVRGQATGDIDFVLERPGSITGRVFDADTQEPLRLAHALLFSADGYHLRTVITDSDGTFLLSNLEDGQYFLQVEQLDYLGETYDGLVCPEELTCDPLTGTPLTVVQEVAIENLEFRLRSIGQISGTVRDQETGIPVHDTTITLLQVDGTHSPVETETNEAGRYWIKGILPGNYRVVATNRRFRAEVFPDRDCPNRFLISCDLELGGTITLTPGQALEDLDFTLQPRGVISGVVRSRSGEGIQTVVVATSSTRLFSVRTENDGSYRLEGVETGTYRMSTERTLDGYFATVLGLGPCDTLNCDPSGGTPIEAVDRRETSGVDIVVDRAGVISGRVIDGFWKDPLLRGTVEVWDEAGVRVRRFPVDARGWYSATNLADGTYFLSAGAENHPTILYDGMFCVDGSCDETQGTPITVRRNLEVTGIDFELPVQQGVAGAVIDAATGLPVFRARIEAYQGSVQVFSGATTRTGRFVLPLPAGTYTLKTDLSFFRYQGIDQIYDGISCTDPNDCDPLLGAPIEVLNSQVTEGIDFALDGTFCAPSETTLCLGDGQFRVTAQFIDPEGEQHNAQGQALTDDSGTFTFFDPDNVELMVKMLNACGSGFDSYWVFAAGLTNLGVSLEVTDQLSGEWKLYTNDFARPFQLIRDTGAFETCDLRPARTLSDLEADLQRLDSGEENGKAIEPTASETCTPSDTALCLQQGRFRVAATWTDSNGATDSARAVQLTPDTGYFWFFDPDNVEVITKVLDACGSAFDSFWVFAAGLTDVGVVLRVTDTVSGQVEEYENPLGAGFVPIQDTGSFQTCM